MFFGKPSFQSPLAKELWHMTLPMVFGIFSLLSFQLVDSAFIGQLGVQPLAAQGFTLPIQMIIIGLQVGLGIATTSIISRALGANNTQYARQLGGLVLLIGGVGIILFCLFIWVYWQTILSFLGAPQSLFGVIERYWPHWLLSAWLGAFIYFLNSICRANGNTMLPGVMMVVTSIVNVILDPLFIFTFGLGLNGAAMATSCAFLVGIIMAMLKIWQSHWVCFKWSNLDIASSVKSISHIMGPALISQLLPSISAVLATKLIATFGAVAVGAWALGTRFEFFLLVVVLALTMSVPPMVGRLLGAKDYHQIEALVGIAVKFVLLLQVFFALIAFVFSGLLAGWVTSDPNVEDSLRVYLMIVPISLSSLGIGMLMVSVSNAMGHSYVALTMSALRLFAFFLPCIWLGAWIGDLEGVFVGVLFGNVFAGIAAWIMYKNVMRSLQQGTV
ncbi:MATE family efflux transporter [Marinomonas algicola]|uniref:MATE family efflux transporter n=1 Tax=Marinomonas algicola TaxID=2773454 RepID=UPI00174D7C0D|nr:MATE family efflux transporter [Marinomonas algicola]